MIDVDRRAELQDDFQLFLRSASIFRSFTLRSSSIPFCPKGTLDQAGSRPDGAT